MARTRYVAFLRAINVGGRNVTMSALKRPFERLGFEDVDTFIASGNVIFSSGSRAAARLEKQIEAALGAALGYDVSTFVRSEAEVAAVARYQPFPAAAVRAAAALNVGFVTAPLPAPARAALEALSTDIDLFHAHGREIYWLCRKRQSESTNSNSAIERALRIRSTMRGMNTVVRLAAKLEGTS